MLTQINPEDTGAKTGNRRKSGRDRQRMCLVTREVRPQAELIRFARGPDGVIVADIKACLPGRGVWVSASHAAIDEAVRRRLFANGFKASVDVPDDLADQTGRRLSDSALGRLGLTRKAGQLAVGFTKVSGAIGNGLTALVLIASDAAGDGRRKIEALIRKPGSGKERPGGLPVKSPRLVDRWSADELSLAIGRTNAIHAAVLTGAAGRSLEQAVLKLIAFEGRAEEDAEQPQEYDV